MIQKVRYYLSRPGYYLSIAYYDISFKIIFILLVAKLLLFDYIMGLGTLSFSPDFGIIVSMLGLSLLIRKKSLKLTFLFSLNLLCSFIFLLNSLYKGYFGDFASAYCINQIPMLTSVTDSVIYLTSKEFLFIVDFLFLPFLFLFRVWNYYLGLLEIVYLINLSEELSGFELQKKFYVFSVQFYFPNLLCLIW